MNKYNVGTMLIVTFLAIVTAIAVPGLSLVQGICLAAFGGTHGWYQTYLFTKSGDVFKFMGIYIGMLTIVFLASNLVL